MTLRLRFGVGLGLLLAPLSLVALGACVGSTIATEAPAAAVVVEGDQVVLGGARGFAAAEIVYIATADAATRLAKIGVIRGERATRLRALNSKARHLLVTGRATLDAAAKARAAAELFGIVDAINSIKGAG